MHHLRGQRHLHQMQERPPLCGGDRETVTDSPASFSRKVGLSNVNEKWFVESPTAPQEPAKQRPGPRNPPRSHQGHDLGQPGRQRPVVQRQSVPELQGRRRMEIVHELWPRRIAHRRQGRGSGEQLDSRPGPGAGKQLQRDEQPENRSRTDPVESCHIRSQGPRHSPKVRWSLGRFIFLEGATCRMPFPSPRNSSGARSPLKNETERSPDLGLPGDS